MHHHLRASNYALLLLEWFLFIYNKIYRFLCLEKAINKKQKKKKIIKQASRSNGTQGQNSTEDSYLVNSLRNLLLNASSLLNIYYYVGCL